MSCTRLAILSTFFVVFVLGPAVPASLAQRPGPQFWRRVSCEALEPRTKLEAFDEKYGTVILKGFTQIDTIDVRGIRVDAVELRDIGRATRATGLVIALGASGERPRESRAFIDYEEIDALLAGIDAVSRVNEAMTKLVGFEGTYRTQGDLEIGVFRQTRSGTAAMLSTGLCDQVRVSLSLDDLAKVRAMINEAKTKLDEAK